MEAALRVQAAREEDAEAFLRVMQMAFEAIEEVARAAGRRAVLLGTRQQLTGNVRFYERLGYQIVKTEPHPRGSDMVVVMTRRVGEETAR